MPTARVADRICRPERSAPEPRRRAHQPGQYAPAWDSQPETKRYIARAPYDSLDEVPTDLILRAQQKEVWVQRFVEEGQPRGKLKTYAAAYAAATNKPMPPYTTLVGWAHAYAMQGRLGLVDRVRSDAGRSRELREEEVIVLETGVLGGKLGPAQLLALLVSLFPDTTATYDIVYRWLAAFKTAHRGLYVLATEGASRFRTLHRLALAHPTLAAGQAYSVDSTPADVWVRVPDSKVKDGWKAMRPVLTVVQDLGSRAILTFNLSLQPISAEVVRSTMRRAVDPTHNYPALPSLGVPEFVVNDAGSEHRSFFENAMKLLGVRVVTGGTDAPESHAHIERVIGTITTECLKLLPGYSASTNPFNPDERPEGDAKRNASRRFHTPYRGELPVPSLLSLTELEAHLLAWSITYNARPHTGLAEITPVVRALFEVGETDGGDAEEFARSA